MKKITKLITLLLGVCFLFGAVSCKNNSTDSSSGGDSTSSTIERNTNVRIADNGKSNYTIVTPSDPLATETYAAEELSKYIEMISGAKIRILKENEIKNISTKMKLISVGQTDLMDKAGLDYSDVDFNSDGFIEKTVDNTIFLCGSESDRSHLYAVYDFLELYLGCKFFTRDFEYIPTQETIYLPLLDVVDVPVFSDRYITYNALMDIDYTGKARLTTALGATEDKHGETWQSRQGNNGHNIASEIVPYWAWGDLHPEWYYMDGSYRMFDATYGVNDDGTYDDTLEDNPIDIAVESLKRQILDNPGAFYFNCSYNDSSLPPDNPIYTKRAAKYGHSGVLIQFISLIIERLDAWIAEETRPDGLFPNGRDYNILMFAYFHTVNAPLDTMGNPTVECPENLAIWLCPIGVNVLYSINDTRQEADQQGLIEGWYKLTKNLCIWDYFGYFFDPAPLYYNYYFTTAPLTYKYYADMKLSGFVHTQFDHESVGPYNAMYEMQTYVASKLMWDPYRYNSMELVEEYCDYYYGEYGADIYNIIVQMEDYHAIMQTNTRSLFMNHSRMPLYEFFSLSILEKGIEITEEDLKKNQQSDIDETEKARLDKRLKQFQVILRSHILKEYSSYYGNKDGYQEWSNTFFNLLYELDFDNDYLAKRTFDNFLGGLEDRYKPN